MKTRFLMLGSYSVAMALVEAAVVVYLRALYAASPIGLVTRFSNPIYRVEIAREAATIIMIVAVGYLAFKQVRYRILAFLWVFSVWDIFYYVFLKLILGWPASPRTLDVLFLIPVPWVSPVWFPLGVSSLVLVTTSILFVWERSRLS